MKWANKKKSSRAPRGERPGRSAKILRFSLSQTMLVMPHVDALMG